MHRFSQDDCKRYDDSIVNIYVTNVSLGTFDQVVATLCRLE
jgi:hypothetical protein